MIRPFLTLFLALAVAVPAWASGSPMGSDLEFWLFLLLFSPLGWFLIAAVAVVVLLVGAALARRKRPKDQP